MKCARWIVAVMATLCLALAGPAGAQDAAPANSINALSVVRQGDDLLVRIDLKKALTASPAGFSVTNPPRVALDFSNTLNALGYSSQAVNQGDLKSLNVVQAGERTRLVFNLAHNMNYTTRLEGKSLYISLAGIGRAAGQGEAEKMGRFAEASVIGTHHTIRDITFRRGKEGEGRIIVELGDSGTGIDIRQEGSALVVDFLKTSLPESLRRKLDVTDFATPVTSITTQPRGDHVRMAVSPQGLWEHNAYQSDNQFIIEVKKIVEDPNKLVQGSRIGYQGPRVSINYQNGEVRALLRLMAEELGLNAVISETVTGTTTLVLKDVPADQVIDIIFQQKGLDMRKNGNVILVAPRGELATREKLEYEARQQISELEPLKSESFQLNYQKAVDVARLLAGAALGAGGQGGNRILSRRGNALAEPVTNILLVNEIPAKLDEIRKFILAIDRASRQVMIEARVVIATDNFSKDVGVRLGWNMLSKSGRGGIVGGPLEQTVLNSNASTLTNTVSSAVNLPARSVQDGMPGALSFVLFNASRTRFLNLELSALEADLRGKVVSNPRVLTADKVKATIKSGTKIPYATTSANQGTQTTFQDAVLMLEVTPTITPDGNVLMDLIVKKDKLGVLTGAGFAIDTNEVQTKALVENGGTIVVGGVYEITQNDQNEKIPFLGDLPYVGFLFKHNNQIANKLELLVFITPKIVSDQLAIN